MWIIGYTGRESIGRKREMRALRRRGVVEWCLCAALFAALLTPLTAGSARSGDSFGPEGPEEGPWRRQVWRLPSPLPDSSMRAVVLRPPGAGPFPLMVMNHGSTQSEARRMRMGLPEFAVVARWFVRRGYAVALPQRPGHGLTGGRYLEDQNGCEEADFFAAGHGAADSIAAAIAYLAAQPFVDRREIVVVGQSAGAWGSLALASRNPAGVKAVIAFAPGRGGRSYDRPDHNCAAERLVAAARRYGGTARVPTLWLHAENDSYFPPSLSRRLAAAFRDAGGRADERLLPAFGSEGHFVVEDDASEPLWAPAVDEFLRGLR
jgi:dienelactone hydrolase